MELRRGDLLVFDGQLIHRSSDNISQRARAAAVLHFAASDTVDHSADHFRHPLNDWMPLPGATAGASGFLASSGDTSR